jgi:hypothetical protein
MAIRYNLVEFEDQKNITVVLDGEMYVADNNHPNWPAIFEAVQNDREEGLADLFDTEKALAKRFDKVSERVSIRHGKVHFDGDVVDNALTQQIIRFLNEGVDDWKPLVAFMEKVQTNPQEHSREQLYQFLARHEFTITDDGDILGYKGVTYVQSTLDEDEHYLSTTRGEAFVNGEPKKGYIPQRLGDVVEMPRSAVAFDPSQGCSTGLHVANHGYALTYGNKVLLVRVNPRDVVSVPDDANWQKVRVCRYEVVSEAEGEIKEALYTPKHAAPVVSSLDSLSEAFAGIVGIDNWDGDEDEDDESWSFDDDEDDSWDDGYSYDKPWWA